MKVIFLDFDGVMDTAYYDYALIRDHKPNRDAYGPIFDPKCVDYLRQILEQTGANIVVSSTWKFLMSYAQLLQMWKDRNLPGQIIGVTPTYTDRNRGYEIDLWLQECAVPCQYVIIDDLDGSNFKDYQIPHLLVVNPYMGLDDLITERAIALLNQKLII